MALANAVKGGVRPAQTITWSRADGFPEPLAGATLTGWLRNRSSGVIRPIAGALTVTGAALGEFRWDYHADDVAEAGSFDVQFQAAFTPGPTPARTFLARWKVDEALD